LGEKIGKKSETITGLVILAVLVLIGITIYFQQFQYNPAVKARSDLALLEKEIEKGSSSLFPLPENLSIMTPVETFTPETLYEKIDGQADLYLASGFVQLKSQRYVRTDNQEMWFEVFKYDMGTTDNAFSVYSQQYRDEGRQMDWARFAYSVPSALFFVHGQDYIEMRAANTSDDIINLMHKMAQEYVEKNVLEKATIAGLSWFPEEGLEDKSVAMVSSNAFGFDRLNQVYTAEYLIDGVKVTAYISKRSNTQEAAELAAAFADFYLEYGGNELETGFPSVNGKSIEIMDSINIIFSRGAFLAGVHEAGNMDIARELANRLYEKIGDMIGEKDTGK
jgi:hypothetical protein